MQSKRALVLDFRICWMVVVAFAFLALFPVQAQAGLLESQLADGSNLSQRADQVEKVRHALENELVAQRLTDYGLTAAEVSAKLDSLSDEQLHQLASLSDSLAEGGILGLVIAVLIIALLVIVIMKLTNKEIVIK